MNYPRAEALYDSTLVFNADSAGILWRLARLYVCKGDVAGEESQHEIYLQAEGFARRSIAADSMQAAGYTWLAAALGSRAMREGSRNKVQLCNEIKRVLDIAVTLDSTDDVAYSIMGSFYLALGNISWIERQLAAVFIGRLPRQSQHSIVPSGLLRKSSVIGTKSDCSMRRWSDGKRRARPFVVQLNLFRSWQAMRTRSSWHESGWKNTEGTLHAAISSGTSPGTLIPTETTRFSSGTVMRRVSTASP